MAVTLIGLPAELQARVFSFLLREAGGPRYVLVAPSKSRVEHPLFDNPDEAATTDDRAYHAHWKLKDPGPLALAATCKVFRDVYLSSAVPGNLVLEIPSSKGEIYSQEREQYDTWFGLKERNRALRHWLRKGREAWKEGRGKCVQRLVLDCKWVAKEFNVRILCCEMWSEILGAVAEVWGAELGVVVCMQGEGAQDELRRWALMKQRALEDFGNPVERPVAINSERHDGRADTSSGVCSESVPSTTTRSSRLSLRSGRNPAPPVPVHNPIPSTKTLSSSAPLSLHLYFARGQLDADQLMGTALSIFSNHNLRSLVFVSDPNNFNVAGHNRRPAAGHELYTIRNPYFRGCPWRWLLPMYSSAHETLQTISLDCALFFSELAYMLPHLSALRTLDMELAMLRTEPVYPGNIETKENAQRRVLEACFEYEKTHGEEMKLKKNKEKKWLSIEKENVVLPWLEPEEAGMPNGTPRDNFASVHSQTCLQVAKRRIFRFRREERRRR